MNLPRHFRERVDLLIALKDSGVGGPAGVEEWTYDGEIRWLAPLAMMALLSA